MNEIWPDWPEIGSEGKRGWVFWVTGLSGSGKTTIGQLLFRRLRERAVNSVFLDGDVLRQVFGNDLGYTLEERRKCARSILTDQCHACRPGSKRGDRDDFDVPRM